MVTLGYFIVTSFRDNIYHLPAVLGSVTLDMAFWMSSTLPIFRLDVSAAASFRWSANSESRMQIESFDAGLRISVRIRHEAVRFYNFQLNSKNLCPQQTIATLTRPDLTDALAEAGDAWRGHVSQAGRQ